MIKKSDVVESKTVDDLDAGLSKIYDTLIVSVDTDVKFTEVGVNE